MLTIILPSVAAGLVVLVLIAVFVIVYFRQTKNRDKNHHTLQQR